MQLLQDRISGGGPAKWLGVGVVMLDELIEALRELLDAGERAAAHCRVGDQCEEALIQPWPTQPRAGHAVGMTDRDAAAVDVELARMPRRSQQ